MITVNRIAGNRVAIGIEAPREVSIVRGELDQRDSVDRASKDKAGAPNSAMLDQRQRYRGQAWPSFHVD